MRRIVFLGPPGAGKGTQAEEIARWFGIPHLSTGDLLRAAVKAGTPIGREAEGHMAAGRLVPDELVLRLLGDRLAAPDAAQGFLLDGFPRNVAQARALERLHALDHVVAFEITEPVLVERLSRRRTCPSCNTVYNLVSQPPRSPGRCDRDGTALVERPDDRPEAVRTRLRVYREQTEPLLQHYREAGLLRPIDADGERSEVRKRILGALG